MDAFARAADVSIPETDSRLIRTADSVEVSGTNERGGAESFAIHDRKAIRQFIDLLTDDRYYTAPKNLRPHFKSLSAYKVKLSSNGSPILELNIIADSIIDLPGDPQYYVESDRYSEKLMASLMRLR